MTPGWPISCGLVPDWMRVAVEFRHPSWHCEDIFALLERHGAAYCVMSGAGLPCILRATDRRRLRADARPRSHHLYAGSYTDADLTLVGRPDPGMGRGGKDVFVYFNNDGDANAVRNARTLQALLNQ